MAVVFETTPVYLTGKEMNELVDSYNKAIISNEYHKLLIIGCFIVTFLKIHPFIDGNGRLSRLLTNYLLIKNGYEYIAYVSLEKLIEDTKVDYCQALRSSQQTFTTEQPSAVDWLHYFLNILLLQVQQAIKILEVDYLDKSLSPQQLKIWQFLKNDLEFTPNQISEATGVNRNTVTQGLNKLMKLKKIERLGQGRTTRYRKL